MTRWLIALLLAISAPTAHGADAARPWHIYVPGSYTGIMPFLADGIYNAAKAFAAETNRQGGILGRPIEVIAQDDKADVLLASQNATAAFNDPDHLVTVGHSFSSLALPIGRLYNKHARLFFTPYATNSEISRIGGTVFQLCFNDQFQGKTLANVAVKRLHAKKILILTNRSDSYSDGLSESFISAVSALAPTAKAITIARYDYVADHIDFAGMVDAIHKNAPDLIFLPELKVHAADIIRNLSQQGVDQIRLLGADGWGSEDGTLDIFFPDRSKPQTNRYFYTYHWHPDLKTAMNATVKKKLLDGTGKAAYGPGVLTYEALIHLREVIKTAGKIDNVAVAKLLRGSTFQGTTGRITYQKDGTTTRNVVLLELTRDALRLDSVIAP